MDSKCVILVISYLGFVVFTIVIVTIMYSHWEFAWAVICYQYTILYFPSSVSSGTR